MAETKEPIIFISYSHLDEPDPHLHPGEIRWLDYVTSHLKPAAAHGSLKQWDDRRIEGGGDWHAEIEEALNRCAVCAFLVSRHSLSSRFILDVEMRRMLERHHSRGAHLYPIVITSCDLGAAPWLLKLNLKPTNGTALELYSSAARNAIMAELAAEIRGIVERTAAEINARLVGPKGLIQSPIQLEPPRRPSIMISSDRGKVCFDYSTNNGVVTVGEGDRLFRIAFSGSSNRNIQLMSRERTRRSNLRKIARVRAVPSGSTLRFDKYDSTSDVYRIGVGETFLAENEHGYFLQAKIADVQAESHGSDRDEVTFQYQINTDGSAEFSSL